MKTKWLVFVSLLFFMTGINAQENKLLFKDGDRVAFIGNSITHGGEFHPDIFLYYATRFPKEKVNFYNCGVSGDVAGEILTRLDSDVLIHKPNIAVLMVGMNDMFRGYRNGSVTQNTYETYHKLTSQLAERLTNYGCRLILELPSIYDQTSETGPKPSIGVNDALGKCAEYLKSIAPKYNAIAVDYWTIMKDINEQEQKKDSKFTIVGSDRVHPGSVGHLVMAYQFLKTTGAPEFVSRVIIDAKGKRIIESQNCEVKPVSFKKKGLQFKCLENSLPYPVKKEAAPALDLVPLTQDLNQEILQINHILKGKYNLFIDDIQVGTFTSSALSQGINLSMNLLTPQYKQSLEVMKACDDYRKVYMDLRAIAFVEYKRLAGYKGPDDLNAKKAFFDQEVEKIKGQAERDYIRGQCNKYIVLKPKQQQLKEQLNLARDHVYAVNKPVKHIFKLVLNE
jgi:lysophospholipase L1-like esterase